jgi:putative membrane protein
MMFWYGDGMGAWGYALMTVSTVLFWGLVILAVIAWIRYLGRGWHTVDGIASGRLTPEQTLADQFARGEIDEDEYRSRLAILHERTPDAYR